MNNSASSLSTLRKEPVQIPLKGFRVTVKSPKPGWTMFHEGMGEGRIRVHLVKNAK
jgi:hypothetical protein